MFLNYKKYWLLLLAFLLLVADFFIFYADWQNSHRGFVFAMLDVGQGDALFIESPSGTQVLVDGGPPKKILSQLAFLLLVADFFIFYADWQNSHRGFTFAMLDIGQGDALFIESPSGTQVLVDGGPPKKILSQLARMTSPFDRKIDALIITNPDQDHIAGFLDVLKIYEVGEVFEPGTLNDSKTYQNLRDELKKKNIPEILAKKGMKLVLGGGTTIEILFPDRDVSVWAANDGSIVAKLSYGANSIMLTGDATAKTENIILKENAPARLKSSVLKVGHHGSRTSTSLEFAKAVSPAYALISDGKDNKYGHPHQETLNTLSSLGVKILRTDLLGTIIMKCAKINSCGINK